MMRKKYSQEEKAQAVALCKELGVQKASNELGINTNSLYLWMRKQETGSEQPSSTDDTTKAAEETPEEDGADIKGPPMPFVHAATEHPQISYEEHIRLVFENQMLRKEIGQLKAALRAFAE